MQTEHAALERQMREFHREMQEQFRRIGLGGGDTIEYTWLNQLTTYDDTMFMSLDANDITSWIKQPNAYLTFHSQGVMALKFALYLRTDNGWEILFSAQDGRDIRTGNAWTIAANTLDKMFGEKIDHKHSIRKYVPLFSMEQNGTAGEYNAHIYSEFSEKIHELDIIEAVRIAIGLHENTPHLNFSLGSYRIQSAWRSKR